MVAVDVSTAELGGVRLRLQEGLRFSVQSGKHGVWYLVEDKPRSAYYRLGAAEYILLSQLDGKTTLATALATTSSLAGAAALSEPEALALCRWLVDAGLAHTHSTISSRRVRERASAESRAKKWQWINPIMVRVPLGNPDRLFSRLVPYCHWIVSWPIGLLWMLLISCGLLCALMDSGRLMRQGVSLISASNMLWFAVTWILLKGFHETAHALVCKSLGGRLGKCGIMFLLLMPLPFVDVTSSWRFSSKWHRILVAAAGMMAELGLAGIAAVVWYHAPLGAWSFHASNVMIAASVHTLLFNANPLMRFDGYYILADWLELPNLGEHGQRFVRNVWRAVWLGLPAQRLMYAGWRGIFVRLYGAAAFAWKCLVSVTLCLAAANLLPGIGLLLALCCAALWLCIPAARFVQYLVYGSPLEHPNRCRLVTVASGIVLLCYGGGRYLPAPSVITAPAVVDYEPLHVIRCESGGFVRETPVAGRRQVRAGEILFRLENRELEEHIADVTCRLAAARVRARGRQSHGSIAAAQNESQLVEALESQLQELETSHGNLIVRAPADGLVVATDASEWLGQYVQAGTELLAMGAPGNKEVVALVAQEDQGDLWQCQGGLVDIRIWGHPQLARGTLYQVSPRTRDDLPHFALAGTCGGPLDVVDRATSDGDSDLPWQDRMRLVEPRIQVRIALDASTSRTLGAGETGLIHLRGRNSSLGGYAFQSLERWITKRIRIHHGI